MDGGEKWIRVNKREFVISIDESDPGEVMTVRNIAGEDLAFKMKTTNPKRYVVRPNVCCIPRGGSVDVRVFLVVKTGAAAPPPGPSKDRFQLRVALAPGLAQSGDVDEFWRMYSEPARLRLKFPVTFVAPAEAGDDYASEWSMRVGGCPHFARKVDMLRKQLEQMESQIARVREQLEETLREKEESLVNGQDRQAPCKHCQR